MNHLEKNSLIKNGLVIAILLAINVYMGFEFIIVILSLALTALVIGGDLWMLLPLTRRIEIILGFVNNLASGEKDLTKKVLVTGNDRISLLASHFNAFIGRMHNLIGRSMNTANQVASSSAELSVFSSKMASGAEEQRSQVLQIVAAMNELNTTVNEIARNTQMAANSAREASDIAEEGGKTVLSGISGLRQVASSVERSAAIISELGDKATSIGEIISLIDDIADQTNLLALNAAIEAARAGEYGRGFAVVADEVRKLAERTTKATKEISEVIQSLQEKTASAVVIMESGVTEAQGAESYANSMSKVLDTIVASTQKVSDTIVQIATAAEEQSSATADVSRNVENISLIAQETVKNAKRTSDAVADLNILADNLIQEVGSFKVNLFGIVPLENAVLMNKKFNALVATLNEKLSTDYIIMVGKDYPESIADLGTGKTQIAYQTPTTYIEGKHKYGIRLLGYFAKNGSPTYKSAIVVSKNSGIRSVADLKGKRFAFGSEKSTGSTLVPMSMLAEAGIALKDLAHYAYLGGHDVVANAVLKGEYDAGGMMESVVDEFSDKGIVALKISEPIPQFPICITRDMDPELEQKLKNALLNMTETSPIKAIDKGYTGFLEAKDSDFDGVRAMVKRLYHVEYK